MTTVYDFTATTLAGAEIAMSGFRGRVLLIVNTASLCGFTPQYEGLEKLQQRYGAQGFSVLGFPCNQFGGQEPGDEAEISRFCTARYTISFPMFAKIEVNGPNAHPLYKFLTHDKPGLFGSEKIKWNFTKFLIGRKGHVAARFAPTSKPEELEPRIEALLHAATAGLPSKA